MYTKLMKIFILILIMITSLLANENINPKTQIYIDLNSSDFNTIKNIDKFQEINTTYTNLGIVKKGDIWVKIPLINDTNNTIHRYLEMENLIFENVVLYNEDGKIITTRLRSPNLSQSTLDPTYVLEIKKTQDYYLKITNHKTTSRFSLHLKNSINFIDKSISNIIKIIFVFGFIISLMFYNVLIYFYTKDKSYLYYVIYIAAVLLQQASYVSIIALFFPPSVVDFFHSTWIMQIGLMYLSASLYARRFLHTQKNFPRLDVVYKVFIALAIIEVPLFGTPWFYLSEAGLLTGLLFVFFNTFTGVYVYLKGYKQARFYALAWLMLVVGYTTIIMDALGLISVMYKMPNLILYLTAIEALILSLAFTDRYIILQSEKKKSDQLLMSTLQNSESKIKKEIELKTKELQHALDSKQTLFKELHHRTKNNLQLIISLIRMQKVKSKCLEESKSFDDLEGRIRAISKTHEILYQKGDLELVDMDEYISELVEEFEETLLIEKECKFELDIYAFIPLREAVYIGIIVNEMISNSIKYALKDKNNLIKIYLNHVKGTYVLSYKDSGDGFDINNIRDDALGISLIKTLAVDQLNAQIVMHTEESCEYILSIDI